MKNTTIHYGRKPAPLIYCLRNLQGQYCGTQFLISFLKLFEELYSFIFTGTIYGKCRDELHFQLMLIVVEFHLLVAKVANLLAKLYISLYILQVTFLT